MEVKKLTEEEIKELKILQDQYENLVVSLGNLELQMTSLEFKKNELKVKAHQIETSEISLAQKLKSKYGEGEISLDKGEIIIDSK